MSKNIEADLRALGAKDWQLAGTLIDGKPLMQAKAEPEQKAKAPKGPNKTEQAFARHLDWLVSTRVANCYWYEPMRLRLTDQDPTTNRAMYYVPDFMVLLETAHIIDHRPLIVEIKGGHIWEDAKVKFKTAWAAYGKVFRFSMVQKRKDGWVTIMGEPFGL